MVASVIEKHSFMNKVTRYENFQSLKVDSKSSETYSAEYLTASSIQMYRNVNPEMIFIK